MSHDSTTDRGRESAQTALAYHERTKHHYHRFADSLGYLDWTCQPDPFRRYEGAPLLTLPIPDETDGPSYETLFRAGSIRPSPVQAISISKLFYYSLAISAWKQYGDNRWALRVNPSSGNLHPTEAYLMSGAVPGLCDLPAVHHYSARDHALERRTEFAAEIWDNLTTAFPPGTLLVGLSSIHWRESWKYGERAYRYCQHDAGHALAALSMAAACLGWRVCFLNQVSDQEISSLLGLQQAHGGHPRELESPDLFTAVIPNGSPVPELQDLPLPQEAVRQIERGKWQGKANRLSNDHHDWELIDSVAGACSKGVATGMPTMRNSTQIDCPPEIDGCDDHLAGHIIRQRRSALAMDGHSTMSREQFFRGLCRVMPGSDTPPWNGVSWAGLVHLGIFVHRVVGLESGLYLLVRHETARDSLQKRMHAKFLWEKPDRAPNGLPLYLLKRDNLQRLAIKLSCNQSIAGQSVFTLAMLAEFEPAISRYGAHCYRSLLWETGMIGQILYLEAESMGMRSTGIGCFFDDPVHEVFGLTGRDYQSLYHLATGGPVDDSRLTTLPAYP